MRVYGAYVPFSWWTALVLGLGTALSLLSWRPLVRLTAWRPRSTLVMLLAATAVLALTLTPSERRGRRVIDLCTADQLLHLGPAIRQLGESTESMFNLLLLVPLGIAATLATRRPWLVGLAAATLPALIEAVQTQIPGRLCSPADYLANTLGGLVGVGIGALAARRTGPPRVTASGSAFLG